MKIKYAFATETVEIEVEDTWATVLIDMDRQEYNNDQKESRRHCSLNACDPEGQHISDDFDIEKALMDSEKRERLHKAIGRLEPSQQALIYALFFQGVGVSDYAKRCGISQPAVTQKKTRAIKSLKKILETPL